MSLLQGAGIAIRLLLEGKVESIYLNDYDRSIYSVWYCIVNETERFIRKIENTEVNIESYLIQKEIQKRKDEVDLFELGFSTFFSIEQIDPELFLLDQSEVMIRQEKIKLIVDLIRNP